MPATDEEHPLLHSDITPQPTNTQANAAHSYVVKQAIISALLSPPFIAVIVSASLAFVPYVSDSLLDDRGALRPLILSANILGGVVVPLSSMIVGAELYRSLATTSNPTMSEVSASPFSQSDHTDYVKTRSDEQFGTVTFIAIVVVRMILLPLISRILYVLLGVRNKLANPLLGVFALMEFNVPTANNTVIMITIAAESLPRIGKRLKADVSKAVFWQFLTVPLFLTLNTAAALNLQYGASYNATLGRV